VAKRPKNRELRAPRPSRAATRTGAWKAKFLAALAETGNVTESARRANVERRTAQIHHQEDKAFAEGWAEALEIYADSLEAVADHRATHGVEELKIFDGQPVFVLLDAQGRVSPKPFLPGSKVPKGYSVAPVVVRRPSDALLMKRLAAVRPEKYRERVQVTHDKPDGPRTPAERASEAAALLAELRGVVGVDPGAAPAGPAVPG
jgi:hypothetical protein